MKRVFGRLEAVFDVLYLLAAFGVGAALLMLNTSPTRMLAGTAALVLAAGDCFHLIPRMAVIITHKEEALRAVLGRGKQVTSITMTVFYLLLWQLGQVVYTPAVDIWSTLAWVLALARIALCLLPQNRWQERFPPLRWGIVRNIPFFLLGTVVAGAFFWNVPRCLVCTGCGWQLLSALLFTCRWCFGQTEPPKLAC